MWVDCITVRKRMGCSPFFAVTGVHPILPLDVLEATWLVEYPRRIIEDWELRGLHMIALEKHVDKVAEMRNTMDEKKKQETLKYATMHANKIKSYNFQQGDLVLMCNSQIESMLNTKMKPHYLGLLVVVDHLSAGNYILAELDGALIGSKITAFHVILYLACHSIEIDDKVLHWMRKDSKELRRIAESPEPKDRMPPNFMEEFEEIANPKISDAVNLDED